MPISITKFHELGRNSLNLTVFSGGEYLDKMVEEDALNRPGLALAGFYQHFAHRRIQVLGLAENAYLKSLSKTERLQRLRKMFERQIPCLVLTRGRHPSPETLDCAKEFRVPVLKSPMITNHFINQATLLIENFTAPTLRYQGTMMELKGIGVLLEGPPGIGKSETALALIERGHSLVSDDMTVFRKDSTGVVMGYASELTHYHMEIRGLGIIHVPSLFGVGSMRRDMRLDLVIRLERYDTHSDYDRTGLSSETMDLLGCKFPLLTIPVAAGRDIANVVEVAALNEKMKQLGHDAAKELDEKLVKALERKRTS